MKLRLTISALAGLAMVGLLLANADTPAPEAPLDQAALRRHIEFLASDALEGRAPGSIGGTKAAHYVATSFARAGLLPGAPGGGWYQPVALVERTPGAANAVWLSHGRPVPLDPTLARN